MALDITSIKGIGVDIWKWGTFFIVAVAIGVFLYLAAVWWNRKKRFYWQVKVYEIGQDGRPRIKDFDRGGIMMDKKTSNRLFTLKKFKVGMSPYKIPY